MLLDPEHTGRCTGKVSVIGGGSEERLVLRV